MPIGLVIYRACTRPGNQHEASHTGHATHRGGFQLLDRSPLMSACHRSAWYGGRCRVCHRGAHCREPRRAYLFRDRNRGLGVTFSAVLLPAASCSQSTGSHGLVLAGARAGSLVIAMGLRSHPGRVLTPSAADTCYSGAMLYGFIFMHRGVPYSWSCRIADGGIGGPHGRRPLTRRRSLG